MLVNYADARYNEYRKEGDPLLKATGKITVSNPEAYQAFVREAQSYGVEVVENSGGIYYSPGFRAGMPGQLHISPNNSYGACLHEVMHMRRDKADAWPGFEGAFDITRHADMEYEAYNAEIEIARSINRPDIAEELIEACKKEIIRIGGNWDDKRVV